MNFWRAATALFIAVVAAWNLWHLARRVPPPPHVAAADLEPALLKLERRLSPVRAALLARAAPRTIGYVADLPPVELAADDTAMAEYFQVQFVLVPWILDPRLEGGRWAVANFRGPDAAARLPAGFRVARDFGGGVLLLERVAP